MDYRLFFGFLLWVGISGIALYTALRSAEKMEKGWWYFFGVWMVLLAVALPIFRLRSLMYPGEINVDESQVLSQALRYQMDPLPWRSVDGGSGGPLYTWALLWAPLFGFPLDYFAARVTSLLCLLSTCAGLALAIREIANERLALILTLPAVTALLVSLNLDWVFFSSEQLPMALMAWSGFAATLYLRKPSPWIAYVTGLLTGALPFCKIQVGPTGFFLWCMAVFIQWTVHRDMKKMLPSLWAQVLGGGTFAILILGPVYFSGVWQDFMDSYIWSSLVYRQSGSMEGGASVKGFLMLLKGVPEFFSFALVSLTVSVLCLGMSVWVKRRLSLYVVIWAGGAIGLTIVMGYSIYRTGFLFPHYTQFLVVPLALLSASCAQGLVGGTSAKEVRVAIVVTLLGLVTLIQGMSVKEEFLAQRNQPLLKDWGGEVHPIGKFLRNLAGSEHSMLVWGYAPKFHVFSQLPQATRYTATINFAQVNANSSPLQQRALQRFLSDFEAAKPALFVDAPDEFWFPDPTTPRGQAGRHHNQALVSRIVSEQYELAGQIESGSPAKLPIFVYKRKPSS